MAVVRADAKTIARSRDSHLKSRAGQYWGKSILKMDRAGNITAYGIVSILGRSSLQTENHESLQTYAR